MWYPHHLPLPIIVHHTNALAVQPYNDSLLAMSYPCRAMPVAPSLLTQEGKNRGEEIGDAKTIDNRVHPISSFPPTTPSIIRSLPQESLVHRSNPGFQNGTLELQSKLKSRYVSSKLKDLLSDLFIVASRYSQGQSLAIHNTMDITLSNECKVLLVCFGVYDPT